MDEWLVFPVSEEDAHPKFAYTTEPQTWVGQHYVFRNDWKLVDAEDLTEDEKKEWWNVHNLKYVSVYSTLQNAARVLRADGTILNLEPYLGVREVEDWSSFINSKDGKTMDETMHSASAPIDILNEPTHADQDWAALAMLYHIEMGFFLIGNVIGVQLLPPAMDDLIALFDRLSPDTYEVNTAHWNNLEDMVTSLRELHEKEFSHKPRRKRFTSFIEQFCYAYLESFEALPNMTPKQLREYLMGHAFLPPDDGIILVHRGIVFSESSEVALVEVLDRQQHVADNIIFDDGNVVTHVLFPDAGATVVEAIDGRLVYLSNGQTVDIELLRREDEDVPAAENTFPTLEETPIPPLYSRVIHTDGQAAVFYAFQYDQEQLLFCVKRDGNLQWMHSAFFHMFTVPEPVNVIVEVKAPPPPQNISTSGLAVVVVGLLAVLVLMD